MKDISLSLDSLRARAQGGATALHAFQRLMLRNEALKCCTGHILLVARHATSLALAAFIVMFA